MEPFEFSKREGLTLSRVVQDDFLSIYFDNTEVGLSKENYVFQGLCLHSTTLLQSIELRSKEEDEIVCEAEINIPSLGVAEQYPQLEAAKSCRFEFRLFPHMLSLNKDYIIWVTLQDGIKKKIAYLNRWVRFAITDFSKLIVLPFENKEVFFLVQNPNDSIQKYISQSRSFYELDILLGLRSLTPERAVIYDVGANIGNHTLFFAKYFQAESVYCFEANKLAIEMLEFNCAINAVDNVSLDYCGYCVGHSDNLHMTKLIEPKNNLGGTSFVMSDDGGIPSITIDTAIGDKPCDLIKIDVEGMEADVLKGAENVLKTKRPVVCLEVTSETRSGCTYYMTQLNYKLYSVYKTYHGIWTLIFIDKKEMSWCE